MINKNIFTCVVCGYDELDEPPYDEYGCSSFTICPCCGTEFGYDDYSIAHEVLRQRWVASGMKWWSTAVPEPVNFDPIAQLQKFK